MRRKKIKGKQSKLVTAPRKWKSATDHPEAHLAYITKEEQNLLIKKDLYNSLKGKPNVGPGGIPSLQGDMGKTGSRAGNQPSPGHPSGDYDPNRNQPTVTYRTGDRGRQDTGTGGKPTIDVKKIGQNVAISQGAKLAGVTGPYGMLIAPAVRRMSQWLGGKFKRTKGPTLTEKTAATEDAPFNQQKKMYDWGPQNGGGGDGMGRTQMAATSAQAAQPIKPRSLAMKPYYMGFDFQQAKHSLGNPTGQLTPDPRKQTYQGWQFKKGGLSGGKRFGPPPKKGPNPHGKCPFRPDGIRGVGAVEKGRGVKFIGTK